MRHTSIAGWILGCWLVSPAAWAQINDFIGARPLGMGGSHRAIVTGNDAIVLNPAGMSLFRRYSLESQYVIAPETGAEDGPASHVVHVSVVDNQIQAFATGLAYTRVQTKDGKTGNRYDLAFSMPLTEGLLVGTDIKYLDFDWAGKPNAVDAVSVDVGALLQTGMGLSFGVVGYNLTNTADYLDHPVSMAVAVMYSPFRTLEVSFDWFINFQKPVLLAEPLGEKKTAYGYHFGAEYLVLEMLTLRAGFAVDNADPRGDRKTWSVGAGFVSERFTFDFGYQGSTSDSWDNLFGFGLRLFM